MVRLAAALPLVLGLALGCGHDPGATPDDAAATGDAGPADDARPLDAAAPFDPGPEPTTTIEPVPGELTIEQLDLPQGTVPRLGEAAIIVGPDGTIALLDVGNSNHADQVRAEVRRLNTQILTPPRGFPARAPLQVEWVIITHFHGDHTGALPALLTGATPLTGVRGVVHRGLVDLGPATNEPDVETLCGLLRGPMAAQDRALCTSAAPAPCTSTSWTAAEPYRATACAGLLRGDLATAADDAAGAPSFLSLGGGARLTLIGADGFASDGQAIHAAPPWGHDQNGMENARSLVGLIAHGGFRYHFAGDLTGRGDVESPDLETFLATTARSFYGPRGVDVVHAHHHVRRTSSNAAFVALATPADGRARNVVGGVNPAYVGSPYAEVLSAFADAARLATGWIWITRSAPGGAGHARLDVADGRVIVQTVQGGRGYRIQAVSGGGVRSHAFPSVRAEP